MKPLQSWQPYEQARLPEARTGDETARMLNTLLGNLDGMVYRCRDHAHLNMEFVSEGCRRVTGYDPGDLLFDRRITYESITHYEDRPRVRQEILSGLEQAGRFDCEYRIVHSSGEVRWVWERGTGIYDPAGSLIAIEGLIQDISERKLYQARIEQQASYDSLTGLANRTLLSERLQQAIRHARSQGTRLAVVFVDLDRFKLINDSLGHQVGDELLRTMAARLKSGVRESDTVARLGGDEFVLLLNGHRDAESIAGVLERMLASIGRRWSIPQGDFNITCSMGVALYPDDGTSAETLLKHADAAMYRAKEKGRNNFQFFTAELNKEVTERLALEGKLRRALEHRQFSLHYQPRIDLRSGAVVGAEALIRWESGEEPLDPARFIPVAEETGLIVPIGAWVLETACAQNKAWQDAGLAPLVVSVNVSPRQFRQGNLVRTIADVLGRTGLDARCLEVELTESAVMHDADQFTEMLRELSDLGVAISLDDFGTGYSSLGYLKRFAVDRLKVDRSFVQDLTNDSDDATIVRTIIALGHNLGLKVVAEGVESEQQLEFLRANGCDEGQGHHFGHPLPPGQFAERHCRKH
jgi:diguanylate cyclase (GGDEF)-like protein/PAS domain S-box-containing protein